LTSFPDKRAFKSVVAGVDWGWNDPGAIVVVGDTGKQLIVVDELKEPHLQVIAQSPGERSWVSEAVRLQKKWGISRTLFATTNRASFTASYARD
jgi:hypothetical protein